MDVATAKKTLYRELRQYPEVNGAAIKTKGGSEFIVIFLTKRSTSILQKIPDEYQGIPVKTEIKGEIEAF